MNPSLRHVVSTNKDKKGFVSAMEIGAIRCKKALRD